MTKKAIPALGFVAPSGSGKTTLLRKLVPVLAERGLRLGYLKHAHHTFDLDIPGKDSYEIREVGVRQTLLASKERWALQSRNLLGEGDPDLAEMLARFDGDALDLVLVEGFKHAAFPKIEVRRSALGGDPLYPQDANIIAVVTDGALAGDDHPPVLPIDDPEALADFIIERLAEPGFCGEDPRHELIRYCRWLAQYGYNDSHSGNASVRVGDAFYVTPTSVNAGLLEAEDLILCPLEGNLPPGVSLDAPLHRAVYLAQPEARGVLHSHGAFSVGVSVGGRDFQPVDFEGRYYFQTVPVLNVPFDRYLDDAPQRVAETLSRFPIAMIRGHGVYAWGPTLDLAYKWTCSLELSARIYVIARQAEAI